MKRNQFLLLKLTEECAEVSQRASKQIQFGATESQRGEYPENKKRLKGEILDLLAIIRILEESGEVDHIGADEEYLAYETKKIKLNKYLKYSHELGELPEITI